MGRTLELGRRLELCSADAHCHDISLGLYQQSMAADHVTLPDSQTVPARGVAAQAGAVGPVQFLVHTYSTETGATERVAFLSQALVDLVGLERVPGTRAPLAFPCRCGHEKALKRAFLDICKKSNDEPLQLCPLSRMDKKAECQITVVPLGNGEYRIDAEADTPAAQRRCQAVARGYLKLCEMESVEGEDCHVRFPCGAPHDRLLGLLLFRAQNVRSTLREDEAAVSRGVLAAPSQQV
ncbi:MAG: hypothetical protein VX346_21340 [Planctomycetota bacterium]|nr:hypothetical protein [Planctomycetota bacterium]